MTDITLFHTPGACSRVTLNALEEIGLDFDLCFVNIGADQQKAPEYLSVNPKGKVPALLIGDRLLAENAAILHHLDRRFPAAKLLPPDDGALGSNQAVEDLIWCSATLHPMTRQVRAPMRFTTGETQGVMARGKILYQPVLATLQERLEAGTWWYGAEWSIIDVYLYWNYSTAESGGLDLTPFPALERHRQQVRGRPSFQRSIERDRVLLEAHGLDRPFGATR